MIQKFIAQRFLGLFAGVFVRRDGDDATLDIMLKQDEKTPAPEWREPPGRLGEYVRRVKRLSTIPPR